MPVNLQMNLNEYLPLRDVVFNTLRQAILEGKLKPGERLMEIKLANSLGVSRTPVREAIHMLELEGLVTMVPRKGAQVANITEQDLKEVLEVRQGLEELVVRFACQRITKEQLEKLKKSAEKFKMLIYSRDLTALAQADVEFHEIIYEAAGNKRMNQILNNLREQMYRYRIEYLKDLKAREGLAREHMLLYQALADGDYEHARKIIDQHILNQQNAILQSMREQE